MSGMHIFNVYTVKTLRRGKVPSINMLNQNCLYIHILMWDKKYTE